MCIRELKDVGRSDVALVGGKAASLGELIKLGIPVPEGFVILSQAFDVVLSRRGVQDSINKIISTVNAQKTNTIERASKKIQSLIVSQELPHDIHTSLQFCFTQLGGAPVAVRSSATSEDSAGASWAGQLDSYLNVSKEDLARTVVLCWASLFTARAILYRIEKNLSEKDMSVAVIVQKMVSSECSGVGFSCDPLTGDRSKIVIEAGFGLGESIVQGAIIPEHSVVSKQDLTVLKSIPHQQNKGVFNKAGGGTVWKNIRKEEGTSILTRKDLAELARLIKKIEQAYNVPIDVEWAKEKGTFYVVQSRPITVIDKKRAKEQPANTSIIQELLPLHYWTEETCIPLFVITDPQEILFSDNFLCLYEKNMTSLYYINNQQEQEEQKGKEYFSKINSVIEYSREITAFLKELRSLSKKDVSVMQAITLRRKCNSLYAKTEAVRPR